MIFQFIKLYSKQLANSLVRTIVIRRWIQASECATHGNGDGTQKVCEVCTPDIAGEFPPDDGVIVNYPNDSTFENAVPWCDVD